MGLFDNIFSGQGGGLFPQFAQPSNPQFRDPRELLGAISNFFGPAQSPQFSDPRTAANAVTGFLDSPQNPRLRGPIMQAMPNVVDAQYPPQLNMTGLARESGAEDVGLNMGRPNYGSAATPTSQPQITDPWAGIRGVNEQPAYSPPDQAALPTDARPTQGPTPPQFQGAAAEPDFASRLGAGFMGFANAKSPMQALGNLVGGLATGQRSDPQGMLQQQQSATFKALVQRGVPPSEAMAATLNPEIMKIVGTKYFDTQAKPLDLGTDPLTGEKHYGEYRPGQPLTKIGFNGQQNGGAPTFLAQGVTSLNRNLVGDDYLAQFSPEVQSAVKAYIRGDSMPTSNPRLAGGIGAIKQIAQKYGDDVGTPVSDALYSQRRTYRSQLGSNSPSSAGGQAKSFNQGIEHLSALADTLDKLDNSNGLGIPSLASGINSVRQGLSTDQAAIADKASGIGQALAGEIGKLFSGAAGGGVHERQTTMERFNTVKSKPQLAAALEATLELMHGGLVALEQRRDEVLGPNSDVKFVTSETQNKIEHIQQMIDRLKGRNTRAAPSAGNQADPLGIR